MYTYEITPSGADIYNEDIGIPMPENPAPKEFIKSIQIEWTNDQNDSVEKILQLSRLVNSMNEVV